MYDCMKSLMNSLNAWHIWYYGFVTFPNAFLISSLVAFVRITFSESIANIQELVCRLLWTIVCLRKRLSLAISPTLLSIHSLIPGTIFDDFKPRYLPSSVVQLTTLNLTTSRNRTNASYIHFIYYTISLPFSTLCSTTTFLSIVNTTNELTYNHTQTHR